LLAGAHHKFSSEESSSINFHLHIIYLCPHILIELCMTLPKACLAYCSSPKHNE